ncbi:hypothetical protein BDZ45DRAFT_484443 [Acephala macrosclerotiorum]|nr:hypothetical protein BDZ45DRAFT_484443 [Acephala macrosclerotiorum]
MSNHTPCQIRPGHQVPGTEGGKGDIQENGFIQFGSRTHDTSLTESHVPDIRKLGADLNTAVQAVWPTRRQTRYTGVHVLMISWEDDDLGVWRELEALRTVFEERYHFQVEEYRIPSIGQPDRALKRRAIEFLDHSDGEETLLIMYYAGHARRAPEENAGPLWCANRSNSQPAISSGGTQSLFEEADADVLLIYDCCHSAGVPTVGSTVPTTGQKTKGHAVEIIAACGYETVAPEVDQHSFTKALTEILALSSKGEPFSVGILHSRVLGKLKCWAPSLQIDKKGKFVEDTEGRLLYERQPRRTPIYSIVCETEPRRSILLSSMSSRDSSLSSISSCGQNTPSPSSDPDSALSNDPMTAANSNPRKGKRSLNENGEIMFMFYRTTEGSLERSRRRPTPHPLIVCRSLSTNSACDTIRTRRPRYCPMDRLDSKCPCGRHRSSNRRHIRKLLDPVVAPNAGVGLESSSFKPRVHLHRLCNF